MLSHCLPPFYRIKGRNSSPECEWGQRLKLVCMTRKVKPTWIRNPRSMVEPSSFSNKRLVWSVPWICSLQKKCFVFYIYDIHKKKYIWEKSPVWEVGGARGVGFTPSASCNRSHYADCDSNHLLKCWPSWNPFVLSLHYISDFRRFLVICWYANK